jgi:uncharacterized membrane protein
MYEKYSDDELIEAYLSMMDYSGEINKELSNEIESRGGLDDFKEKIKKKSNLDIEIMRISKEVYSLTSPETDVEFIKKAVTSDVLTREELDSLIESKFVYYQSINSNRAITQKTLAESLIGIVIAIIPGAVVLALLMNFITPIFLFFIVPVYIVNYLIIWLVTKKTRSNLAVFIATFIATIGSVILGIYLFGFFFES